MSVVTRRSCPAWVPAVVLVLTVAQLMVAEWWPGIERFADKAFGARLVAYPVLMLLAPAIWWLAVRRREPTARPPYGAFTLVMLPPHDGITRGWASRVAEEPIGIRVLQPETLAEAVRDIADAEAAFGVMPPEVLAKLNEAMVKVLTDPTTVKRFADLTAEASPSTPQELAAMLDKEDRTVVPLLKKLGVKPESTRR